MNESTISKSIYLVELRLQEWGNFHVKELEENCPGAPKRAAFVNERTISTASSVDSVDASIIDTNKAMRALMECDYSWYRALREKYTARGETEEQIARRLSLSTRRYRDKVRNGKIWLSARLGI